MCPLRSIVLGDAEGWYGRRKDGSTDGPSGFRSSSAPSPRHSTPKFKLPFLRASPLSVYKNANFFSIRFQNLCHVEAVRDIVELGLFTNVQGTPFIMGNASVTRGKADSWVPLTKIRYGNYIQKLIARIVGLSEREDGETLHPPTLQPLLSLSLCVGQSISREKQKLAIYTSFS